MVAVAVAGDALAQGQLAARAGVTASVKGDVRIWPAIGGPARPAGSGTVIFVGDRIETSAVASLQLLMLDRTVFTVGPGSSLAIDTFVYDPKKPPAESGLAARLTSGIVRYISGDIAARNPLGVNLKLPVGTIGVRGTALFAMLPPPGGGEGFVGLLGPGPRNDADMKAGGLEFAPAAGGPPVEVLRGDNGFALGANGAPGPVGSIPPSVLARFDAGIAAAALPSRPGARPADAGAAADVSGGAQAQAKSFVGGTVDARVGPVNGAADRPSRSPDPLGQLGAPLLASVSSGASGLSGQTAPQLAQALLAGQRTFATFAEAGAAGGTGLYSASGVPIHGGALKDPLLTAIADSRRLNENLADLAARPQIGSFNTSLNVDFASRSAVWQVEHISVPSLGLSHVVISGSLSPNSVAYSSFAEANANKPFHLTASTPSSVSGKFFRVDSVVLNANGSVTGQALTALAIMNTSGGPAVATGAAIATRAN